MIDYAQPQRGIYTFPLFDQATCAQIIEQAHEEGTWDSAEIVNKKSAGEGFVQPQVRSASVAFFGPGTTVWSLIHERVDTIIRPFVHTRWRRDLPEHETIQVVRYLPGDFYKAHRDAASHYVRRFFSVVTYLNDDFEGGGTHFPHRSYTVVPEQGKTVVFPSNYLHQAERVRNGTKYVAVTWLLGDRG